MARNSSRCRMAFALAMLVGSAVATAAAPDAGTAVPFLGGFLEETRIVYPLRVGDWEAVGEHRYDAAELGASVRYQAGAARDRWIDIYFYPVGVVPRSHLDEAAMATLREIESGVGRPGGYVDVQSGPLHAFLVRPAAGGAGEGGDDAIPARSADLHLQREKGAYNSAMTLLIDRLYYVKGRYSLEAGVMGRAEVRAALEAFVTELVRGTYIGSTGRCWSPAGIEALPVDAAAPAGSRLSIESDGGDGAWLVGDRVLARDPAGDAAQALALLAMAHDGRLYPGCVGADPHNPDVPEGRREIRLDYRAPTEKRRDGDHRLAPSRGGLG